MERPAVLLVDGSSDFLAVAARALAAEGIMVVGRATSVEDVVAKTSHLRPDLAVLDLAAGDWLEVLDHLRGVAAGPRILVVALSEHESVREQALAAGADAVLAKSCFRESAGVLIRSIWRARLTGRSQAGEVAVD
jgi:CheY-like chemotaxis protein